MIAVTHPADSSAQTDDIFLVRYNGQHVGFYLARILPFLILFLLFALFYLDDDGRRWIFSRQPGRDKPFRLLEFLFLMVMVAAPLVDLAMTFLRVRPGAFALSVSANGITGSIFHRTRLLAWDDITDVSVDGKYLVVRRQPRSLFQKLFARRGLSDITVPVDHLDRGSRDILAAVRRYAPAHQLRSIAA